MVKMVVFDMAGTVVDEDNVVYKTLRRAVNETEYEFTLDQVLAAGAGKEKFQAIKDILKLLENPVDEIAAKKIYERFVVLLDEAYKVFPVKEQPGSAEVFEALRDQKIQVVLNTGYNQETAEVLMKKLGWQVGRDVNALITATQVEKNRPNPDMIWRAMNQCDVTDASTVVKVGDSIIDIEEGKNAGCGFTVGITTGAHTRAQLATAQPDFIIDHLRDLLPLVLQQY